MKNIAVSSLVLALSIATAHAQQWNDAIQFEETNVRAPFAPISSNYPGYLPWAQTPTTNLAINAQAYSCGSSSALPAFTGGVPFGTSNLPSSCVPGGSEYIDLGQFARQGDLVALNNMIQFESRIANAGIAQALAMAGTAQLQDDEHFAVSLNMGEYRGQSGFAIGGSARLAEHVSFNAGVTGAASGGPMGGRAGLRFGW